MCVVLFAWFRATIVVAAFGRVVFVLVLVTVRRIVLALVVVPLLQLGVWSSHLWLQFLHGPRVTSVERATSFDTHHVGSCALVYDWPRHQHVPHDKQSQKPQTPDSLNAAGNANHTAR